MPEIEDPNVGSDQDIHSEPNYVDLDAQVVVKSGLNVGVVEEDETGALSAAAAFMKHPNRALSSLELGVLMEEDEVVTADYIDRLVEVGFLFETNELDGVYKRFRVAGA